MSNCKNTQFIKHLFCAWPLSFTPCLTFSQVKVSIFTFQVKD